MSIDKIIAYSEEIKQSKTPKSQRQIYQKTKQIIASGERLLILRGLRGSGKTTILRNLQKELNGLYISGDFLKLEKINLTQVVSAAEFLKTDVIIIDEIQYTDWKLETKVLYDLKTKFTFIISGSSALLLTQMSGDLKRRASIIEVGPLSFSEYLTIRGINIDIKKEIRDALFNQKNQDGYYKLVAINATIGTYRNFYLEFIQNPLPALFEKEEKKEAMRDIAWAVIDEDLPKIENIETDILRHAKDILHYLAVSEKISTQSMADKIGISKSSISKLLDLLEKAQLISSVPSSAGNEVLKGRKKYVFACPLLRAATGFSTGIITTGFGREDLFVRVMKNSGFSVSYSYNQDQKYDFLVDGKYFEIGGSSKRAKERIVIAENGELEYNDGNLKIPLELLALLE